MHILSNFDQVRRYLANIHCINSGGCGVSSLAMYKWLEKNNELEPSFRFVICYESYQEGDYENNYHVLRTKEGIARATSHIAISLTGNEVIDCNGRVYLSKYSLVQFVKPSWFLVNMINNKGSWNPEFNRDNINLIEQVLGINLSEIKQ